MRLPEDGQTAVRGTRWEEINSDMQRDGQRQEGGKEVERVLRGGASS